VAEGDIEASQGPLVSLFVDGMDAADAGNEAYGVLSGWMPFLVLAQSLPVRL
jgi:hypothetical protein